MKRLLYISAAAGELSEADIADILASARRNNVARAVTGLLLHIDGGFLQVLEGPGDAVDYTYARIARDPRHRQVITLWSEPITQRDFPNWSMGFDRLPADDPRWRGAFRIDPRDPAASRAPGRSPEIMALMTSFIESAEARRFA